MGILVTGLPGRPTEYVDYFAGSEPVLRPSTWEADCALFMFLCPDATINVPPRLFGLSVGGPSSPLTAVTEPP
ncbi:MAG: hypothetical protein R3B97_14430 [Dehalococcoidia bacterium]|nr:hypothetical protein [Dehalococcoidia bacterium]MCB9485950.1 hypothetical protein [Thermoflexaceae bacterium]